MNTTPAAASPGRVVGGEVMGPRPPRSLDDPCPVRDCAHPIYDHRVWEPYMLGQRGCMRAGCFCREEWAGIFRVDGDLYEASRESGSPDVLGMER